MHAIGSPMSAPAEYDLAHPWRRQPCDDDDAWLEFERYLYGAHPRPEPLSGRMAAANCWPYRVAAWDSAMSAEREATARRLERQRAEIRDRHLRQAIRLQELAMLEFEALASTLEKARAAGEPLPGTLTPRDALRILTAATSAERDLTPRVAWAGDAAPDGPSGAADEPDLGRVSLDDLRVIARAYRRATGG